MASFSTSGLKTKDESEDDVVTQVQQLITEEPAGGHLQTDQTTSNDTETSEVAETATPIASSRLNGPAKGCDSAFPPGYQRDDTSAETSLSPASGRHSELPAEHLGVPLSDDVPQEAASGDVLVADAGDTPTDKNVSSPQPDGTTTTLQAGGGAGSDSQHSAQEKLQEAINKVEELDRSLEQKLKENMDAQAVTADLQALIRRELEELNSSHGGRRATQEEIDNTLHFLRVLTDNDSESDASGRVTPIFQTQVRFGGRGRAGAAADPATGRQSVAASQSASGDTVDPTEAERPPPPPPPPPPHSTLGQRPTRDQYFIRRNIELAQEAGGSLAMTEEERRRLEQLLVEDDDLLENAFTIAQPDRQLLNSLDDRLSNLGAVCSAAADTSATISQLTVSGDGGAADDVTADDGSDGEPDYLQMTRQDREIAARLEAVERRLEQLAAPTAVRRLARSDVDSMIQDTIVSLASVPRSSEPGCGGAGVEAAGSDVACSEPTDGGASPRPASEAPTETTLDVRSVLSGSRQDENEQQLAEELRPGSPTAWLVDVSQGQQKFQLVVPRLSHQLIADLLDTASLLPAEQRPSSGVTSQSPVSVGAD